MGKESNKNIVSVIVTIHNVEDYLNQCIESLINQTYRNIEIILVDDGSPDNCPQICDNYAKIDKRIKVIHQNNAGLVSARKTGLENSTGEFIGYVDGDDWVEPLMYEEMVEIAVKHDADIVAAGHKEELGGKVVEILTNKVPEGIYKGQDLIDKVYSKMLYNGKFSNFGIFSYVWSKIFKRSVIYNSQMSVDNRIIMAEDAACTYPTFLDAEIVYVSNSTHYRYRQRADSMVKAREKRIIDIDKFNVLYKYMKGRFLQSKHAEILLKQLDYFILSLLTVRSDILINNKENELFPFNEIKEGKRIVIAGAGTFGQNIYKKLINSEKYEVIGWIDDRFEEYKKLGLQVESPEKIIQYEYDFLVVAYIDEVVAETVALQLVNMGADEDKICKVDHYTNNEIHSLLRKYGIDV